MQPSKECCFDAKSNAHTDGGDMKLILKVVLIFAALFGGAAVYQNTQKKASIKQAELLVSRWQDASKIAGSTSRISLPGPVKDMQQIIRDTESFEPQGACLDEAKKLMLNSMKKELDLYLRFMGGEKVGSAEVVLTGVSMSLVPDVLKKCK